MDELKFRFHFLDDAGNKQGFLSSKGSFDGNTLTLGDIDIPAAAIAELDNRGKRVVVAAADASGEAAHFLFEVTGGSVDRLKEAIGRARSASWAHAHREELDGQGRGHAYRDALCPHCGATLDLTGMPETPQVSCDFCHTVGTLPAVGGIEGGAANRAEKTYRVCDECGMYSKPRQFTIFYFYFLLVVYGWSHRTVWRCPACMRPEAWKMLFGNLLFVLGVPVALVQLFRAYGGTDVGGRLPGLDKANLHARNGRFPQAIAAYQNILKKQPISAGVKYNIGLAFLHQDDYEGAAKMLEYSLADCANYQPAAQLLAGCYEKLGATEKLESLKQQWGVEEEGEGVMSDE